jgi:hypothetical protein
MSNNKILLGSTKVGNANVIELRDNATKSVLFMGKSYPAGVTTYLRFDENTGTSIVDTVGGLTGTLSNANIWTASGKNNSGVEFTTGQTISIPYSSNFAVSASGGFSMSVWVYTKGLIESGGSYNNYIITLQYTGTNFTLRRFYDGYMFVMRRTEDNGLIGVDSLGGFGLNVWHHIVVTHDPAAGTIMYINGAVTSTNSATGTIVQQNTPLIIGKITDTSRFVGILDELAFWQRTLTSDEVTDLYNNGIGLYN